MQDLDKNKIKELFKVTGKVIRKFRNEKEISLTMLGYENGIQGSLIMEKKRYYAFCFPI